MFQSFLLVNIVILRQSVNVLYVSGPSQTNMVRLSIKFLAKSFCLVMSVMFLLPIIMYHMDSGDDVASSRKSRDFQDAKVSHC